MTTILPDDAWEWAFSEDLASLRTLVRLAQRLQTGGACMLAGAGVAAGSGFPTWGAVLDEFGTSLKDRVQPDELEMLKSQKDKLWRAEEYRARFSTEATYLDFLRQRFAPRHGPVSHELMSLVRLNCKHVFTTNYDVSLEVAHQAAFGRPAVSLEWNNRTAVRAFLCKLGDVDNPRHYVHLHGRFDQPEQIVFTYRDYVQRYLESDEMVQRLFVMFATQNFVFVGFSLEDPDFVQILRQVNSRLGNGETHNHFAILPLGDPRELPMERRRLQGKYDVDPIFYSQCRPDHHVNLGSVIDLLIKLQDEPGLRSINASRFELSRETAEGKSVQNRPI